MLPRFSAWTVVPYEPGVNEEEAVFGLINWLLVSSGGSISFTGFLGVVASKFDIFHFC